MAGFYGKLPARGDFVRRRLPHSFVQPWDHWLQSAIASSREALAASWFDLYMNGPIWRFAATAGTCGPSAVAGVLMPSVDNVNRHFPLTVAAVTEDGAAPFHLAATAGAWFAQCEEMALSCLDERLDLAILESRVADLHPPPRYASGIHAEQDSLSQQEIGRWPLADAALDSLCDICARILDDQVSDRCLAYSLWWTLGSASVRSRLSLFDGLPPAGSFHTFLTDGS